MDPVIPALFTCNFKIIAMLEPPKVGEKNKISVINKWLSFINLITKGWGEERILDDHLCLELQTGHCKKNYLFIFIQRNLMTHKWTNTSMYVFKFKTYDSLEILEILCNIIRSKAKIYPLKNNTWNSKDVCIIKLHYQYVKLPKVGFDEICQRGNGSWVHHI